MSRNIAASVRQKLLNLANAQQEDFQGILTRYALERLLYRLSQSRHHDRFILKGAMLFTLWSDEPHRATRDLDLLGKGDNSIPHLEEVFQDICSVPVEEDGLHFRAETVKGEQIKGDKEYPGIRIKLNSVLTGTNTRIAIQVDIGFGDTAKQSQWRAFIRKGKFSGQQEKFAPIVTQLQVFLEYLTTNGLQAVPGKFSPLSPCGTAPLRGEPWAGEAAWALLGGVGGCRGGSIRS
jgi:Nucleotidyl transferase AbiEii toxin, Type IV TA system